jgi:Tol biopolymer transport system component
MVALLAVLAIQATWVVAQAHAAFPGQNGKIAFDSDRDTPFNPEIYVMNADGSSPTRLTTNAVFDARPAWSPDGSKIAFESQRDGQNAVWVMYADGSAATRLSPHSAMEPAWSPDGGKVAFSMDGGIFVINANGTGGTQLTSQPSGTPDGQPAWSPDGTKIAFLRSTNPGYDIYVMSSDGTGQVDLTPNTAGSLEFQPNWSPEGRRIAFVSDRAGNDNIYSMNADGSGVTPLTTDPARDDQPAWSTDGSKIAFDTARDGASEIYVMAYDGTSQTRLTNNPAFDDSPDWQPIPFTGYPRPKSASPIRVSLVPAYNTCSAPNRTHGPPLAFDSCNPPAQASSNLTLGTPDANGAAANSIGWVRLTAYVGVTGPPDDSDVLTRMSLTDVRCQSGVATCGAANTSGGADYTGEVQLQLDTRLTDKWNETSPGGGIDPATVTDLPLVFTMSCTSTASAAEGSSCQLNTSLFARYPGSVRDSQREVWAVDQVRVIVGGPDGDVDTTVNSVFEVQGLFVP